MWYVDFLWHCWEGVLYSGQFFKNPMGPLYLGGFYLTFLSCILLMFVSACGFYVNTHKKWPHEVDPNQTPMASCHPKSPPIPWCLQLLSGGKRGFPQLPSIPLSPIFNFLYHTKKRGTTGVCNKYPSSAHARGGRVKVGIFSNLLSKKTFPISSNLFISQMLLTALSKLFC